MLSLQLVESLTYRLFALQSRAYVPGSSHMTRFTGTQDHDSVGNAYVQNGCKIPSTSQ